MHQGDKMDYLSGLNPEQLEAVRHQEGPLLILAGAGSGKTRVLTCRAAYLIDQCHVDPWNIMAITFTNKAAGEMRERIDKQIGAGAERIWVSTFHSSCARILRRFIDRIGYDKSFTIYDSDDSRQVMREVIKRLELNTKIYKERGLLSKISAAKNEMIDPELFEKQADGWNEQNIAKAYFEYERVLRHNNALDFDDLLVKTVELFRTDAEVLAYYQDRFRYIMVDEYQDTNTVQFAFVHLLASKYRNLCVVGDDDQSIYKFRGANIRNILDFEKAFPGTRVIKLEQNYRSTSMILNAANEVIANNHNRKEKRLWSDLGEGKKVECKTFETGFNEAEFVANAIRKEMREGKSPSEFAILYRTNAQSRLFEEKFVNANIPYKIVGGINFYARKEIKDILAYLKTIDNGSDDLACQRIINVPKRGIGLTTVSRIAEYAREEETGFFDALVNAQKIPGLQRASAKLAGFSNLILRYRAMLGYVGLKEMTDQLLDELEYVKALEAEDTPEANARIENIDELLSKIAAFEEERPDGSLSEFLQQVALVADIDTVDENSEYVLLMTIHAAKGLEFDTVYLTGMEDGIFPGFISIDADDPSELEEERRLCYVGMTRAKRHLILTGAKQRMVRGETNFMRLSRFLKEIPRECVILDREQEVLQKKESEAMTRGSFYGVMTGGRIPVGKTKQVYQLKDFRVKKADSLDYEIGDQVSHIKFGTGVVKNIVDGGRDFEVTVDFEVHGTKKMFASFAKLKKI